MNIFQRISKLLGANINHMLDKAEDPEVMVKQIIRDMEESIIELRRETVRAIGQQKTLEKRTHTLEDQCRELDEQAGSALEEKNEDLAREILSRRLDRGETLDALKKDLASADLLAGQLKGDLFKLEDQVQIARRKKEELIRRKRSVEAQLRTQQALQKSKGALSALSGSIDNLHAQSGQLESYESNIRQLESEAEAARELMSSDNREDDLSELLREKAVEEALENLKKKLKKKS